MRAMLCDMCGGLTDHGHKIMVSPITMGIEYHAWSSKHIEGEYCDGCYEKIREMVCELRGYELPQCDRIDFGEGK